MRDLGFDDVVGLSFTDPGMPGGCDLGADDSARAPIRVSNPLSADHSELRTTLLGSLLDVARYNLARGAERVALFESGRVYLAEGSSPAGGPLAGSSPGERPAARLRAALRIARARGRARSRRAAGAAEQRPADFFALKGVLEALAGPARRGDRGSSRSAAAVPAPGAGGPVSCRRRAGRLARRDPPARLPGLGSRPRGRLRGRPRRLVAASPSRRSTTRTSPPIPRSTRTSPSSSAEEVPAAQVRAAVLARRRRAAALGRGLRPLPRASRSARAQEPGAAARVPRRRPHAHR